MQLQCQGISTTGMGVCKLENGYVIFVPRVLPGEVLTARITTLQKSSAQARKLHTLQPHAHAVQPPCSHFAVCGGCSLQALEYSAQLAIKEQQLVNAITRIGKAHIGDGVLRPIVGCSEQYRYRNKMTFTVSQGMIGLRGEAQGRVLIEIQHCWLQDEAANAILNTVQIALSEENAQEWTSSLFKVTIRKSSLQYAVILHSSTKDKAAFAPIVLRLQKLSSMASIVHTFRSSRQRAPEKASVLWGAPRLTQVIKGLSFQISPLAFSQVNVYQTGILYDMIAQAADLRPSDVLLDLFCGAGLIGLSLAARTPVSRLVGIDIDPNAIHDANANAKALGIPADFFALDLTSTGWQIPTEVDVVVADPARAGLDDPAIEFLQKSQARTIVYVSCNPPTQARDIARLCSTPGGWRLVSLQGCDMFPQTSHVESVATLQRS